MYLWLARRWAEVAGPALRIGAALALALLLSGVPAPAPGEAAKVTGIVVDDTGTASNTTFPFGKCGQPNYNTIQTAVDDATVGDTILVCAGNYPGSVSVGRTLRILGAQWGKDARNGRTNVSKESVVNHDGNTFGFLLNASNIIVDGFTIQKVSGPASGNGIETVEGLSGYQILNNVLTRHQNDVLLASEDEDNLTVVRRNFFKNVASNASPPPDPSASKVGITNDVRDLNDVLIELNRFTLHSEEAIVINGQFSTLNNVTIRNNQLVQDREIQLLYGNGVDVLNNLISRGREVGIYMTASTHVRIMGNTIERQKDNGIQLDAAEGTNDNVQIVDNAMLRNGVHGIIVVGNDAALTVQNNTMQDNGGSGIYVLGNVSSLFLIDNLVRRNGFGGVTLEGSSGVTVRDSVISDNRLDGVAAIGATTGVTIQNNDVFDNTRDGIFLESTVTAVTLTLNVARDNVDHDCHDDTGPPSVNFWALSNQGKTQNQPGLCNGAQTVQRVR